MTGLNVKARKYLFYEVFENHLSRAEIRQAKMELPQRLGMSKRNFERYIYAEQGVSNWNLTPDQLETVTFYFRERFDLYIPPWRLIVWPSTNGWLDGPAVMGH